MKRSVLLSEGHQHIRSKVLVLSIMEARIVFCYPCLNENRLLCLVFGLTFLSEKMLGEAGF